MAMCILNEVKGMVLKNDYFFKHLIPQLLYYFNNDVHYIKDFILKVIIQNYDKGVYKNEKKNTNDN